MYEKHSIPSLLSLFEAFQAHGGDLDQLLDRHHLNLSERTLRRKLDAVQVSYRSLLDEHRKERALSMLVSRSASIQQMAEALGYAEDASFLRAFKRWTGLTPRQYLRAVS